jgi:hypothetical protein
MEGARARKEKRSARGRRSVYAAKGPGASARGATVRTTGEGRMRGATTGATRDTDARASVRPQVQCPRGGRSRYSATGRHASIKRRLERTDPPGSWSGSAKFPAPAATPVSPKGERSLAAQRRPSPQWQRVAEWMSFQNVGKSVAQSCRRHGAARARRALLPTARWRFEGRRLAAQKHVLDILTPVLLLDRTSHKALLIAA